MLEKGSSNDKVVHVAEVRQPLPVLFPCATAVLSHGLVTSHLITANLDIQVSHDNGEVMVMYCIYICLELLVEGILVSIFCHLLERNTGSV